MCQSEYDYFNDDENLFSYWLEEIYNGAGFWEEYYLDTSEGKYTLVRAYMKYDKLA